MLGKTAAFSLASLALIPHSVYREGLYLKHKILHLATSAARLAGSSPEDLKSWPLKEHSCVTGAPSHRRICQPMFGSFAFAPCNTFPNNIFGTKFWSRKQAVCSLTSLSAVYRNEGRGAARGRKFSSGSERTDQSARTRLLRPLILVTRKCGAGGPGKPRRPG